jgi:hypothetical protein
LPFARVIVELFQVPLVSAVHVPLALDEPPEARATSQVPVPRESQAVPWIWKVQMELPLPLSLTIAIAALLQAQAGLAPAVARNSSETLMRIARYPAALRIVPPHYLSCEMGVNPRVREKQGPLHHFEAG